jgi:hypothetical protein
MMKGFKYVLLSLSQDLTFLDFLAFQLMFLLFKLLNRFFKLNFMLTTLKLLHYIFHLLNSLLIVIRKLYCTKC